MITVTLDKEMEEVFKNKAMPQTRRSFHNGASVSLIRMAYWTFSSGGNVVFGYGPKGTYQYDNEFIEWLKENRPEVFL